MGLARERAKERRRSGIRAMQLVKHRPRGSSSMLSGKVGQVELATIGVHAAPKLEMKQRRNTLTQRVSVETIAAAPVSVRTRCYSPVLNAAWRGTATLYLKTAAEAVGAIEYGLVVNGLNPGADTDAYVRIIECEDADLLLELELPHGVPCGFEWHTLVADAATVTVGVASYNPFAGRKTLPGLVHAFGEPGQYQRDYMGGMPCKFHPGGESFLDCIMQDVPARGRTASLRTTAKHLFQMMPREKGEKILAQCSKATIELSSPCNPFAGMALSAFAERPPVCHRVVDEVSSKGFMQRLSGLKASQPNPRPILFSLGTSYGAAETEQYISKEHPSHHFQTMPDIVANEICNGVAAHVASVCSLSRIPGIGDTQAGMEVVAGDCLHLLSALVSGEPLPCLIALCFMMPGKVSNYPDHHVCTTRYTDVWAEGLINGTIDVVQITTDTLCSLRELRGGRMAEMVLSKALLLAVPLPGAPPETGMLCQLTPREKGAYSSFDKNKIRQKGVCRTSAVQSFFVYNPRGKWRPNSRFLQAACSMS